MNTLSPKSPAFIYAIDRLSTIQETSDRSIAKSWKKKALLSEIMAELGRNGGKIGGKRSLTIMTAAERSARAKKASLDATKKRTKERLAREAKRK